MNNKESGILILGGFIGITVGVIIGACSSLFVERVSADDGQLGMVEYETMRSGWFGSATKFYDYGESVICYVTAHGDISCVKDN